jgi:CBS domain-containing protein
MRIALAGPLVNLLIAAIAGAVIYYVFPQARLWSRPFVDAGNLPRALFWSNVFLGAFNLLPAYPMDGGRVLRAFLTERMEYVRATRFAVTIGQGFATLLILLSAWNPWLALIGVCLFFGAQLEDRSVVFQSVLESVRMEDVMLTGFSTLSPADTLEDALHKAVHTLQDDFPVVRGMDMVGVISKQRIVEALRNSGNGYVQAAMVRAFDIAQRNDSLASAFRKLGSRGLNMIPVVDQQRLVGIVTMQNLMHSMALLAETRRLRRQQETS